MKVIKRNGTEVDFDKQKITNAISKANKEVPEYERLSEEDIEEISSDITRQCREMLYIPNIENIQDMVEKALINKGAYDIAKRYIIYRYEHALLRETNTTDKRIFSIVDNVNEEVLQENSNKNPIIIPTQRDYMAGEVSKDITRRYLLPKNIIDAHDKGIIHFHDMDYFIQHSHNCCLVNLEDMLQNGTVISGTKIDKPHTFHTACNIATQIIAQVASSQYGGQTISLAHLSPFINETRKRCIKKYSYLKEFLTEEQFDEMIEKMVDDDIEKGIQTIQYQVITLMTTNGQAPFVTLFLDINEIPEEDVQGRKDLDKAIKEVLKQRMEGVKNEKDIYITNAFPKLIYILDENNVSEGSEYWETTVLAAKCSAKRLVPDYISAKKMREYKIANLEDKVGDVYPCMGCRSFLTPHTDHKYYGRFNQGVVTINLPDVALSSDGDVDKFWEIFEDRLENICYPALMTRHERLEGTVSDVAPILWQHGALARLKKGEVIDELLHNNYSTISLGFAGLYECVKYMTGKSHTDEDAKEFGLQVMQYLNDKCEEWKKRHPISFSVYGTPELSWVA